MIVYSLWTVSVALVERDSEGTLPATWALDDVTLPSASPENDEGRERRRKFEVIYCVTCNPSELDMLLAKTTA